MGAEILCEDKLLRDCLQLNEEVGKRIAAGEDVSIREEDLTLVSEGHDAPAWDVPLKRCSNCGYETKENFEYCPKCGKRF